MNGSNEIAHNDVTIIIPAHTPRMRNGDLNRALASVWAQTRPPEVVIVQHDYKHEGSAVTRNKALQKVDTHWVAFLDSDDELLPEHLEELLDAAWLTAADVVYPGCDVIGGHDPHDRFGQPFDADLLREKSYIPVTSLVRTFFAQDVGGFACPKDSDYDDWGLYRRLLEAGAKFHHHPVKTWRWFHTGVGSPGVCGNTSGRGDRW